MPTPEWLQKYWDRGFRLVFYPQFQKGPTGKEAKDWQKKSATPEDFDQWVAKTGAQPNVGVFLGTEISPGRFLADVDFDWIDGIRLSRRLLPGTGFGFGREGKFISHAFYTTPEPLTVEFFKDIDDKTTIVELRGLKDDGSVGLQTMVPPSVHPSNEQLVQRNNDDIGHVKDLRRHVVLYAVGCLLYRHLADRGLNHDTRLAAAGFFLKEGMSEEEVTNLLSGIAELSNNDVTDVPSTVRSTANRLKAHEPVKGRGDLAKALGKTGPAVLNRILRWMGREDFVYNDKGRVVADNETNIVVALEKLEVRLAYDEFNNYQFIKYNGYEGKNRTQMSNQVWLDIQNNFHFRPGLEYFYIVTESVSHKRKFHPVKDYLDELKWDGIPRLDMWLIDYGGAGDSEYTRAISSIVLIAAVRRVRNPGCKFDELMVLESDQGMQKSSALKTLCPREEWFSDDLPLYADSKEIIERTAGKWIIEASELSGMSARNVDHLKSMLSRTKDESRMAYGRMREDFPRQFIIIGTTNSHKYLQDDTGNRRFWPVRVEKFDLERLRKFRDQLWAEAAAREADGESIRLREELYASAGLQQERRRIEDPWEFTLATRFGQPCANSGCDYPEVPNARFKVACKMCGYDVDGDCRILTSKLFSSLGISVQYQTLASSKRVANIMKMLGFSPTRVRDGETVGVGWIKKGPE